MVCGVRRPVGNMARDPAALIAEAIARALQPHLGLIAKTAKKAALDKLGLGSWLQIDITKIGKVDGLTLADALRVLHEAAARPVALIIDEAQHALTSEAGENAMSALKSARDQLNRPGDVALMLVMSGSDRDKLLRLVNTSGAPFYGSQSSACRCWGPISSPTIVQLIEAQRPDLRPVDVAALQTAFEGFGNRPQFFMEALGQKLSPLAVLTGRFEPAMLEAAKQRQHDDEAQMGSDYASLKPTEQAVLWRMLEQGSRFRPYDAEALKFYRERVGRVVSAAQAQKAMESLRQRMPALVWKAARGDYAVEDDAMQPVV